MKLKLYTILCYIMSEVKGATYNIIIFKIKQMDKCDL